MFLKEFFASASEFEHSPKTQKCQENHSTQMPLQPGVMLSKIHIHDRVYYSNYIVDRDNSSCRTDINVYLLKSASLISSL